MQDIVPKKSIREITKPHVPRALEASLHPHPQKQKTEDIQTKGTPGGREYVHTKNIPPRIAEKVERKERAGKILFGLFVLICAAVLYFLHTNKSVTVYITPEIKTVQLDKQDIVIPNSDIKTLEVSTTSIIALKTTTGTPTITKAKGEVIIYNANSTSQTLVVGTRLKTKNGLIYRLDERVVVPASKREAGKEIPGSITTKVTADKGGEAYNVAQTDFVFPGLEGSPRYKTVYARTKSNITGGAQTSAVALDEVDKKEKITSLQDEASPLLKSEITKKLEGSIAIGTPSTTHVFKNIDDKQGEVQIITTVQAVDSNTFASLVARKPNTSTSTTALMGNTQSITLAKEQSGSTSTIVRSKDEVSIRVLPTSAFIQDTLTGKPFSEFRDLVSNFEDVREIRFTSRPFWMRAFPKPSYIEIQIQN